MPHCTGDISRREPLPLLAGGGRAVAVGRTDERAGAGGHLHPKSKRDSLPLDSVLTAVTRQEQSREGGEGRGGEERAV